MAWPVRGPTRPGLRSRGSRIRSARMGNGCARLPRWTHGRAPGSTTPASSAVLGRSPRPVRGAEPCRRLSGAGTLSVDPKARLRDVGQLRREVAWRPYAGLSYRALSLGNAVLTRWGSRAPWIAKALVGGAGSDVIALGSRSAEAPSGTSPTRNRPDLFRLNAADLSPGPPPRSLLTHRPSRFQVQRETRGDVATTSLLEKIILRLEKGE